MPKEKKKTFKTESESRLTPENKKRWSRGSTGAFGGPAGLSERPINVSECFLIDQKLLPVDLQTF